MDYKMTFYTDNARRCADNGGLSRFWIGYQFLEEIRKESKTSFNSKRVFVDFGQCFKTRTFRSLDNVVIIPRGPSYAYTVNDSRRNRLSLLFKTPKTFG